MMPRCMLAVEGSDHDITNLLTKESLRQWSLSSGCHCPAQPTTTSATRESQPDSTMMVLQDILRQHDRYQQQQQQQQQYSHDNHHSQRAQHQRPQHPQEDDDDVPLYPNLKDPCNRRMIQDVESTEWHAVPLMRPTTTEQETLEEDDEAAKLAFVFDWHNEHQRHSMTPLPQRACSAPLHTTTATSSTTTTSRDGRSFAPAAGTFSMPPLTSQTTMDGCYTSTTTSRQQQLQHRHSSPSGVVPGDIFSSASGLRPKLKYKSIYSRRSCSGPPPTPTLESSVSTVSLGRNGTDLDADMPEASTSTTSIMTGSDHPHHRHLLDEEPVPRDFMLPSQSPPRTVEISPNVHVPVRPSQETYRAVRSGDYTVATCFGCCAAIVCVKDAAYVLCPGCQVVSPLAVFFGAADGTTDETKKLLPHGIGIGLKREWVQGHQVVE